MQKSSRPSQRSFPSTWWTLVGKALDEDTGGRSALEELVSRYRRPLRLHLVRNRGFHEELADELLQGFITEKIIERYLLAHAKRDKGKFRSLLVRSLNNYAIDWLRHRKTEAVTGQPEAIDAVAGEVGRPADAFDAVWARQLLEEVLAVMKADCEANRQPQVWGVFKCRLLAPVYEHSEPVEYEEVCRRFGFASPEQASNALMTAKRKFLRAFDKVAFAYRHDGEETSDVLRELVEILSRVGPLDWQASQKAYGREVAPDVPRRFIGSRPDAVAQMLGFDPDVESLWRPDELKDLLNHQLAQRLSELDLNLSRDEKRGVWSRASIAPLDTLGEAFNHPSPGVELLIAVKNYGRQRVHRPQATLPQEIASVVYFAAIATALARHGARISSSDDGLLRWGMQRVLENDWLTAPLRELFEDALSRLAPSDTY